jgi:TRAP-type C4-dicarboxylate transport system substrate-binding protein
MDAEQVPGVRTQTIEAMRHFGKYTYMTETKRAADYRARVGNLRVWRTVYPEPKESIEQWAERVKRQNRLS